MTSVSVWRRVLASTAAVCTLAGFAAPGAAAFSSTTTPGSSVSSSLTSGGNLPLPATRSSLDGVDLAPSDDTVADVPTMPSARISSVGDPLLESGQDLRVQAEITNPLDEPITVAGISLFGQDWAPDTRSRVLRFLEGGPVALSLLRHIDGPQVIPAGQSASFDFMVPRDSLGWSDSFDGWGPRGIEIEVELTDGTQLSDRSLAIVAPGVELLPMPTGAVVPLTQSAADLAAHPDLADTLAQPAPSLDDQPTTQEPASPSTAAGSAAIGDADGTTGVQAQTTASSGGSGSEDAAGALSTLQIPGVTVVLDPSFLADTGDSTASDDGSVASGESPPVQSAMDSFAQVTGTELLFTAWNDVDAQALVHAEQPGEISNALAQAEAAAAQAATRQGSTPRTDMALLPAGSDQQTVSTLSSIGVSGVILPDNDVPQDGYRYATASARTDLTLEVDGSGQSSETADGEYPVLPALAVDSVSSSALSGVLASSEEGSGEGSGLGTLNKLDALDSRQLVLALSAVTYRERPNDSRAMLLSLDRAGLPYYGDSSDGGDPSSTQTASMETMAETLQALMNAPWVEPATVSELMALEPSSTSRANLPQQEVPGTAIRPSQIVALQESLATIQSFANLSPTPALLVDPTRQAITRTLALTWRSSPGGRMQLVNEIRNAAEAFPTALQVRPSSTINIISQATELPVHVSNDLAVPIGVVIQLDSHDNRLTQKNQVTVTLPPNQVSNVSIPVTARGSGNIQVVIRILDPTGHEIGSSQTLEIRVRADWENMGTLAIAIGLGVILVFGVIKSLRRGQKHAPVDPADYARAQRESSHVPRHHRNQGFDPPEE